MITKLKFNKIALAVTVSALLGAGSVNAAVTYNVHAINPDPDPETGDPGSPAWLAAQATYGGSMCYNGGGACSENGTSAGPWTAGNPGYSGSLPATWIATIQNAGGVAASETASSANAGFRLDMGARAYKDNTTNWGHTTDFGLFTLQQDALVTISVSSDNSVLRPAFGLWRNWATSGTRHVEYRNNGALDPMGTVFGATALSVVASDAWAAAATQGSVGNNVTATLTKFLTAGNYTLILGGYDTINPGAGPEFKAYSATISAAAAPVPLPAAAWLFGPALAGLGVIGRGKKRVIS